MNIKQKNEILKSIDFLEELIWLMDSKKNLKIKDIPKNLRELIKNPELHDIQVATEYKSTNPNIHFLIGILPRLFKDESIFPTNHSITNFAESVLGINISRQDKRSKYELIGLIICETDSLTDSKLKNLVEALSKIITNDEQLNRIKENQSNNNFSWNETIQELSGVEHE